MLETSESGMTCMVAMHDYLDSPFDHWENGSPEQTRTVTIAYNDNRILQYRLKS